MSIAVYFAFLGERFGFCFIKLLASIIGSVPEIKSISFASKENKPLPPCVNFCITFPLSFSIVLLYVSLFAKLSITRPYSLDTIKYSDASVISCIFLIFSTSVRFLSFLIFPIAFSVALCIFFSEFKSFICMSLKAFLPSTSITEPLDKSFIVFILCLLPLLRSIFFKSAYIALAVED